MKKKPILGIICLVIIPAVIIFGDQVNPDNLKDDEIDGSNVFHIRLADPTLYEKGVYVDYFQVEKGVYEFRFVPNGDSPQTLSISITGDNTFFSENFELVGTLVETDISQYYTWDYRGQKHFEISDIEKVKMVIDPYGNVMGTVSVYIIQE